MENAADAAVRMANDVGLAVVKPKNGSYRHKMIRKVASMLNALCVESLINTQIDSLVAKQDRMCTLVLDAMAGLEEEHPDNRRSE